MIMYCAGVALEVAATAPETLAEALKVMAEVLEANGTNSSDETP